MSILSSPEFDTQTDSEQLQYWLDAIQYTPFISLADQKLDWRSRIY